MSTKSNFRVYFRGVDLAYLAERYLKGEFINLTNPLPVDTSVLNESPQKIVTIKDTTNTVSYQLDIGGGQSFACIGYKVKDKDGRYAFLDPQKEYRCMYCLRTIKKNPLGIPIRREEKSSGILYYHMVDTFCTINCALAELQRRLSNCIYSQSMILLAEIHHKCTGEDISKMKPSSDQRLLEIFNGPMSWDEFHSNTMTYAEKPGNMFFLPVRECLEQTS